MAGIVNKETEWATGNGRTWYFDDALGRKVVLDSPQAFLAYQAQQFKKLYHMTKGIVNYGDAIEEMSLNDIEKAKKAVVNMFVDHEIDEVLDDDNE
tara:strand:+ start:3581 stop:3868 length:288 start_codon:yes stop_codon:yes gene_type:complete